MKQLVRMFRRAGAREVHLRVASPTLLFPSFCGIDTPSRGEWIASSSTVEEYRRCQGAGSLECLEIEDSRSRVDVPNDFCCSRFDGAYPVALSSDLGKSMFEGGAVGA